MVIMVALAMILPGTVLLVSENAIAAPASGWSSTVIDSSQTWSYVDSKEIKVDNAGHTHVVWEQSHKIYYATNKTGAWITIEVDKFTTDQKYRPVMAINNTNSVFISYSVWLPTPDYKYNIKLAVIDANAATASIETIDSTSSARLAGSGMN